MSSTACTRIKRPKRRAQKQLAALLFAVTLLGACTPNQVDVRLFEDITPKSGLAALVGMTHGAAWGDYDGDGRPDLYLTNHLHPAQLFRNLGGGQFEDVTSQLFAAGLLGRDKHGAAWADFDNDGQMDLVVLTGALRGLGTEGKFLFRNTGNRFEDVAGALGVSNPYGRTRMPLWLDLDNDGRLDLLQGAETRFDDKAAPFFFHQIKEGFTPENNAIPFASRGAPFCILTELPGNNRPGLVCRLMGQGTAVQVFDLSSLPAKVMPALPQTAFEDIAVADFDNDGQLDLFLARKNPPGAIALAQPTPQRVIVSTAITKANAHQSLGFRFKVAGAVEVRLLSGNPAYPISPENVRLGASGAHPAELGFTVDPSIGTAEEPRPGSASVVQLAFTAPDRWTVHVSASSTAIASGKPAQQDVQVAVTSAAPISDLEPIGSATDEAAPFRLFMNRSGEFVEESDKRGVNARIVAGMNVVAADFDNDMDIDLYVLASGDIGQQGNLLLLNDGTGHFSVVKGAGGASGSNIGVGDSVTTADADGDGFLDLLLANGGSMGRSLGLPSDGGGYQLFHNIANNGNHWLMIDLEGTRSNRDGIGAVVKVTAGGVTQVRMQDGGVHHRGQNHSRLHFGLGNNAKADRISVRWPGGAQQELRDIEPDRTLKIREAP